MLNSYKYNNILKYVIRAQCIEPLHIGSANNDNESILIHPVDDVPFIQSSSIAGLFRNYYSMSKDNTDVCKLFGGTVTSNNKKIEYASRIKFSDGIFEENSDLKIEIRPHVGINRESGSCCKSNIKGTDNIAGSKFNMEYIGAGATFFFTIYMYEDLTDISYKNEIENMLQALNSNLLQFGGKKSNGCGSVRIEEVLRTNYNLTSETGRQRWKNEDIIDENYEDITKHLENIEFNSKWAYEIYVEGKTEGELLVKSISIKDYEANKPDSENITNAKGEYIIPASSLKGTLRNQMEYIAKYIGNEDIIKNIFGSAGNNGQLGNIVFYDTIVGSKDEKELPIRYRTHIDKFTGGVMYGSLFSEKNISGKVNFGIKIHNRNNPEATCGLLLLALRDLAVGNVSIGSGYSVGKGYINVENITIKSNDKLVTIDFNKNKITDDDGIIQEILKQAKGELV